MNTFKQQKMSALTFMMGSLMTEKRAFLWWSRFMNATARKLACRSAACGHVDSIKFFLKKQTVWLWLFKG